MLYCKKNILRLSFMKQARQDPCALPQLSRSLSRSLVAWGAYRWPAPAPSGTAASIRARSAMEEKTMTKTKVLLPCLIGFIPAQRRKNLGKRSAGKGIIHSFNNIIQGASERTRGFHLDRCESCSE